MGSRNACRLGIPHCQWVVSGLRGIGVTSVAPIAASHYYSVIWVLSLFLRVSALPMDERRSKYHSGNPVVTVAVCYYYYL